MRLLLFFIINLNVGFLFNLFPSILLGVNSSEIQFFILLFLNFFTFLLLLRLKKNNEKTLNDSFQIWEFNLIQKLYIFVVFYHIIIFVFYQEIGNVFFSLSLFLILFSFLMILNLTNKSFGIKFIGDCYSYFCFFIVFSSVLLFFIGKAGILDLYQNQLEYGVFSQFDRNFDINFENVYRPFFLLFVIESFRGIPFFGDLGLFTGISHEPHTAMLFLIPGVLLFMKDKAVFLQLLAWLFAFIFSFISSSVTGIIVLTLCYVIYLIFSKNNLFLFLKLIIFAFLFLYVFQNLNYVFSSLGLEIINTKFNNNLAYSSRGITVSLLEYLYTPSSMFGSGLLVNLESSTVRDVGFISFIFVIIIQLLYLRGLLRIYNLIHTAPGVIYIFLIGVYFFLHSLKIGNLSFQNIYYLFIIYLLSYFNINEKKA